MKRIGDLTEKIVADISRARMRKTAMENPRLCRAVEAMARCGERPMAELIAEIDTAKPGVASAFTHLAANYICVEPLIHQFGAEKIPRIPFAVVEGDKPPSTESSAIAWGGP